MMGRPLVRDVLPDVFAELEALVDAERDPRLGDHLQRLTVTDLCGCDDAFCASFYTGDRPRGALSDEGVHQTLAAHSEAELVFAVDVVDSAIRYVEIISAETEAGRRVARVLRELRAHPQ